MPFTKLEFRPGIVREMTDYANTGGWYDCDKVRFRNGKPEKIKGWSRFTSSAMNGTCRQLHRFTDLSSNVFTACGTNTRVYLELGGILNDITPWYKDSDLTDPLDTTNLSDQVKVTDADHGVQVGDTIEISSATAVGGIDAVNINGVRVVSEIVNTNEYKFTAGAAATSTTSGGGTLNIKYILPDGVDTIVLGTGWGSDSWGAGGWGLAGSLVLGVGTLRCWDFDSYGEDLVMCAEDVGAPYNGVFYWDATTGLSVRAFPISELPNAQNAPSVATSIIVSSRDRHVIAFGADPLDDPGVQDPLLIRWSDQESAGDWRPTTTNTAGDLRLSSGSRIVTARQTRQEIIVWTDHSMHVMRYIGGIYVFGIDIVGHNTSIAGPKAAAAVGDQVFWMGKKNFYTYVGQVREMPCSVEDYVFSDINESQIGKVFCGVNTSETEVIWFYPSALSTENDKYVVFNWNENVWYYGTLGRSAWIDRSTSGSPIAADVNGYLFYHETGRTDGSTNPPSQIQAYIESSPIEIGSGDGFAFLKRVIPDVTFRDSVDNPKINMVLKARNAPGAGVLDTETDVVSRVATSPVEQFTDEVWVRLRGRSFVVRYEDTGNIAEAETTWRIGVPRVEVRTDGRR